MDKIHLLKSYLEESPEDPFLYYALATEYCKVDVEKAVSYYAYLIENHGDYPATYYHFAALLDELGEIEKAEAIYQKGLDVLKQQGEQKLWEELKVAYYNFQMENL